MVLVVGGTSGFGAAIAHQIHKMGGEVVTVGRSGGDFRCDVGEREEWVSTIGRIVAAHPEGFDLLMCVVGYARAKHVSKLRREDWEQHQAANVGYVEDAIERIPYRRLVTIGSRWSLYTGNDELLPYIRSKHDLRVLTELYGGSHYVVPAMRTPQLPLVFGGLPPFATEKDLADPRVIGRSIVTHVFKGKESGTYVLDQKGYVQKAS